MNSDLLKGGEFMKSKMINKASTGKVFVKNRKNRWMFLFTRLFREGVFF